MGVISNFIFAYPALLILTGTVALAAGENDFMQVLLMLEFGGLAILLLFLSTWTTNDTNVYTGALSVNLFLPKFRRWKIAAAVGVFGTIFAVLGIFEEFMDWLILSGNLFGPLAGVYVADYWLNQKRYAQLDNIPSYRAPQLVAWAVGIVVGLSTTAHDSMGFELMSITTVPMLDGILAAALVQVILHMAIRNKEV